MRSSVLALSLLCAGCRSGELPSDQDGPARAQAAPPQPAAAGTKTQRFGRPLTNDTPLPLRTVLARPDEYVDRSVTVEGTVRRNCSIKGCWMELAESMDPKLQGCRVTFEDYAFFVPLDSAGARATVQGQVHTALVSAAEVEHMEKEGGTFASKRPDGTAQEIRLVATGVELARAGQ